MVYLKFLLFLFFVCSSFSLKDFDSLFLKNKNRQPSSTHFVCPDLMEQFLKNSKESPTLEKLEQFFYGLIDYNLSPLENSAKIERGYITRSHDISFMQYGPTTYNENRYLKSVYVGSDLLERRKLNESTAKILTELGYREQMGHLMPPRNIAKLYRSIYERLFHSADLAGVDRSEVVLPALKLSRGTEYQFVRPGIDPLPNRADGWDVLVHGVELPKDQWVRMVREKKMLLGTEMFFHDIGHVVDMIERPHYMQAYRDFLLLKNDVLNDLKTPNQFLMASLEYGPVVLRGDIERYLNEFLYLPSAKNIEEIKKLIPSLNIQKPFSLEKIKELYIHQDNLKLASSWLKKRYLLFSHHGGGARDWSVNRYLTPKIMNNGFSEMLNEEASFYKKIPSQELDRLGFKLPSNMDHNYRVFEACDLFLRLEYLIDLRKDRVIPKEIKGHLEQLAQRMGRDFKSFIEYMIALHLSEIHYRIQSALIYQMTPEQIARDTSLLYQKGNGQNRYRESLTYKYYLTYPKYSVQWFLGVDTARNLKQHSQ